MMLRWKTLREMKAKHQVRTLKTSGDGGALHERRMLPAEFCDGSGDPWVEPKAVPVDSMSYQC